MLYFEYGGLPYFGGFNAAGNRHDTRKAANDEGPHGNRARKCEDTRFDKLFAGVAAPELSDARDLTGTEGMPADDTFDADYARLRKERRNAWKIATWKEWRSTGIRRALPCRIHGDYLSG